MNRTLFALAVLAVVAAGFRTAATLAQDVKGERPRICSLPSEELSAAIKNIEDAKKALPADLKDALAKLDAALKILEAAKTAPATSPAPLPVAVANPPAAGDTFTGTVEATHTEKRPRLVVGQTHYELKPAEKADASVKETLAKISSGEATGTYVVKGTASDHTIQVNSITKQ